MAEAVVGAIIEVMLGKLLTLAEEQISLVRHFKDDLEMLRESLTFVQAFLHDAEKKQVTEGAVKVWLRQLEDLVFDADNVIDEIDYVLLSKKAKRCRNKKMPFSFRQKMGSRIKDINERLDKMNERASVFGLERRLAREKDIKDAYIDRETDAFSVDPIFLGRDDEVSEIVQMLITTTPPAGQKSISVLPIVGMGGQGKTTFAKKVFNDEKIKSHFGEKNLVWVYVSQAFDVRNILKNILTSITNTEKFEPQTQQDILKNMHKSLNVETDSMQVLLQKLKKHWGSEKYLIVLDDVWNEDRMKWDDLVNSLSGISSANGYCMIVTTRSDEVASIVKETLHVHKLKSLHKDDCWSIIKAKAFRGGEISFDAEEIGNNIAKKCQGLPLAAKVVGGLLSSMTSKDEWKSIEENWLPGYENPISNVLKLSFDHLPSPSLKKCFAYCSIFPKGHEIDKEQLVELWMAEGFLQTNHQRSNNNVNMETTGSKNLNILHWNSLLQNVRCDDYGNVTHCNMHDLVHDLASSVLCEGDCKIRYIGYKPSGDGFKSIPKGQERYVRTLFFDGDVNLDIKLSEFESLHTLTLVEGCNTYNLPTSIRELKHLRYLDISRTSIKYLPDKIGELYHLQTFRSQTKEDPWEQCLEKLPDSLRCLISLRHLHISNDTTLPPEIGKLTCLQTLPCIRVGNKKGCGISELGKLKDLKGELEIRNLGKVRDENEAKSADLLQKPGIYKLKLVWGESRKGDEESVLEGLQPHPNLKSLSISRYKGKILPPWTSKHDGHSSEGLDNLMEIELTYCSECEELPMLGQLQNLKSLKLNGMTNLKSIGQQQQQQGFTSLKVLNIVDCVGLMNLSVEMLESCALSLGELALEGLSSLTNISEVIGCLHKMTRLTSLIIRRVPKFSIIISPPGIQMASSLQFLEMSPDPSWNNVSFNETVDAMLLQFTSLRQLRLEGMEHWECLPDGIQHLTSLQGLWLFDAGIEALPEWFGNLSSLEQLCLWNCKMLRRFPSEQAMQRLSKLNNLSIDICPLLLKEKRWKLLRSLCIWGCPLLLFKEERIFKGEILNTYNPLERPQIVESEWPKISHIPTIDVDGQDIGSQTSFDPVTKIIALRCFVCCFHYVFQRLLGCY